MSVAFVDLFFIILVVCVVAVTPVLEKTKLPSSAIILIIGVLIGPAGFALFVLTEGSVFLSELAIIFILFYAGLEVQWKQFLLALKPGFLVAVAGISVSAALGIAVSLSFDNNLEQALYVGTALAATSIGLSVPLLKQANVLNTRVGQILLAAAVIDDVLAMYFLSALHASLTAQGELFGVALGLVIGILVLVSVALFNIGIAALLKHPWMHQKNALTTSILLFAAVLSSLATWYADMSLAVGAFMAGLIMAGTGVVRIHQKSTSCFANLFKVATPTFFLAIGLQITDVSTASSMLWIFALVLTLVAIVGKLSSAWLVPLTLSRSERWLLGTSLIPRGEVGLIIAGLGLRQAHLSHHAMIALVVMTIVTAIVASIFVPVIARVGRLPNDKKNS